MERYSMFSEYCLNNKLSKLRHIDFYNKNGNLQIAFGAEQNETPNEIYPDPSHSPRLQMQKVQNFI